MKRSKIFIAALLIFSFCFICLSGCASDAEGEVDETPEQTTEPTMEMPPDFTVYTMDGKAVSLYESFGKPLVVNFWATWCPPCKAEMPAFDDLYEKYKDQVDFMMINLTDGVRDTVEGVETFVLENGYSFPVFCDSSLSAAAVYGVQSIPMTLFFSPDGELLDGHVGAMNEAALEKMLQKMTEEAK